MLRKALAIGLLLTLCTPALVLAESEFPEGVPENTLARCTNGIDDDENELIDLDDPSCSEFAPTLTINKTVINDNGGTLGVADFKYYIGETKVESGETKTLSEGGHQVTETGIISDDESSPNPQYEASYSDDCALFDGGHYVSLAAGDHKVCNIINNDVPPHIITTVTVSNTHGGTRVSSDVLVNVSATNSTKTSFSGSSDFNLNAGAYSLTTPGLSNYTVTYGPQCSGSIGIGQTKTCTITLQDQSTGGGGGGAGGDFGRPACSGAACGGTTLTTVVKTSTPVITTPASTGKVLGVSIEKAPEVKTEEVKACVPYLNEYIKYGRRNNPEEVKKLQNFLNSYQQANLKVTGNYDLATFKAVKVFQKNENLEVLNPWSSAGFQISKDGTGYVYKTTKRRINNIMCSTLNLPMPELK